jgi:hypothetical protein
VRGGALFAVGASCHRPPARCLRAVLTRERLASQVETEPPFRGLGRPRVEAVVWLTEERFVAILNASSATGEPTEAVALFDGSSLVDVATVSRPDLELLRISPKRSYVAVSAGRSEGIFVVRPREDRLEVARFPPWAPPAPTDIRAIAWSPDERFTAVASRRVVYLFRTGESRQGFIGLPFAATDLAWSP